MGVNVIDVNVINVNGSSGCRRCESLPPKISGPGTLHMQFPLAHSVVAQATDRTLTDFSAKCQMSQGYLEDAHGRKYISWSNNQSNYHVKQMWLGAPANSISSTCEFVLPVWAIPKSAGRVTFKTEVSYNDGWPLPVEVVVRKL